MLTPAEIAAEMEQSIDFLATDLHDLPERQRSMRAVFDHSWNTLTDRERAAMEALSLFRGGFTREAALQVSGVSLRGLLDLVNKSLLDRTPSGRYEMHELLRQYAAEKLDRSPDGGKGARNRFCAHYCAQLQQWEAELKCDRQVAALAEMDEEIGNARAAWEWAAERGMVEQLARGTMGLWLFYYHRFRSQEAESAFRKAAEHLSRQVSVAPVQSADRRSTVAGWRALAKVLAAQSTFAEPRAADELCRRSLALLEDPELADHDTRAEKAFALWSTGFAAVRGYSAGREGWLEQSLALYQSLGDRWGTARALEWLASTIRYVDLGEAKRLARESLAIDQALALPLNAL